MPRYGERTLTGTNRSLESLGKKPPAGIGVVDGYGVATGGSSSSITVSTIAYTLLTFTADGNLVVATAGLFDVLMFSGGGGGAGVSSNTDNYGTGGGAGGNYVLLTGIYLDAATHAIDIGAGGSSTSGNVDGGRGEPTILGTKLTTTFSGGGDSLGTNSGSANTPSGGRLSIGTAGEFRYAVIGTAFGGYPSGATTGYPNTGASGAGGAGGAGVNPSGNNGGAGGIGYDVSTFIGGSSLFKGGGGGGGGSSSGGAGGSSVGGAGSTSNTGATAGANTASGGGGNARTSPAGAAGLGGSGICYIRFKV